MSILMLNCTFVAFFERSLISTLWDRLYKWFPVTECVNDIYEFEERITKTERYSNRAHFIFLTKIDVLEDWNWVRPVMHLTNSFAKISLGQDIPIVHLLNRIERTAPIVVHFIRLWQRHLFPKRAVWIRKAKNQDDDPIVVEERLAEKDASIEQTTRNKRLTYKVLMSQILVSDGNQFEGIISVCELYRYEPNSHIPSSQMQTERIAAIPHSNWLQNSDIKKSNWIFEQQLFVIGHRWRKRFLSRLHQMMLYF